MSTFIQRRNLRRRIDRAQEYLDAHPDASAVSDEIGDMLEELYQLEAAAKAPNRRAVS